MRKVLVACRGPLAIRIIDACRQLGFSPIAVAAVSDPQNLHGRGADGCIELLGSTLSETYDSVESIVAAARECSADLVHPGCGALAEDPELPVRLASFGIDFVGPRGAALGQVHDKSLAVAAADRLGIPVLPHATGIGGIRSLVAEVGLPVILKPVRGCLGDDLRVLRTAADVEHLIGEGAGNWYAESYVHPPRVVAVSPAMDAAGRVVELGERETLLLAGGRKLLDASPVLTVPRDLMRGMWRDARRLIESLELTNVATIEFIVGPRGYFFLEVNPRLAGGYRMCEAQTLLDIVSLQLEIADGRTFGPLDALDDRRVHCLEARLYTQPTNSFSGRSRKLERLSLVPEPGVTYDCAIDESRPLGFESMIAQVLATGDSRENAAARLLRALEGSEIRGIPHHGEDIVGWVRSSDLGGERSPSALIGG